MIKECVVAFLFVAITITHINAQKVDEKDVPANIVSIAKSKSKGQAITMWVKDPKRSKYIATIMNNTAPLMVEISMKGEWLETDNLIREEQLPASVSRTLKENYLSKGYEADNFVFIEAPVKSYYQVDVSSEDENLSLKIDSEGKILSKQIR
jgi:hypothetical protein